MFQILKRCILARSTRWPSRDTMLNPFPARASGRSERSDLLFLCLIFILSSVLYVGGLGYYSDDWAFLAAWTNSSDQSYWGLVKGFYKGSDLYLRPMQSFYLTGLYWLFGRHPLGYHAVNSALIACTLLLLYMALRELGLSRMPAVAIASVYGLMPHYSTDRFWIAAGQSNVCMAFCFLSFYGSVRIFSANTKRRWAWILTSLLAMPASLLAYEVSAPLMLLVPVALYMGFRRSFTVPAAPTRQKRTSRPVVLLSLAVLALSIILKLTLQTSVRFQGRFLHRLGLVFWHAVSQFFNFNIGEYGLALPAVACRAVRRHPDIQVVTCAALAGAVIFAYCLWIARRNPKDLPSRGGWAALMLLGLVCYGLGFAPFAAAVEMDFVSTGVENRVTIAAALGTAIWLVGLFGWATSFLPGQRLRAAAFAALVAVYCASGFAMNNTLASYWIEARHRQEEVLAKIKRAFVTLPSGTTLLVDGVCRYVGPGIVFETEWDMAGAVQLLYGDPTLRANVLNPRLRLQPDSVILPIYTMEAVYPYGDRLILYDIVQNRTCRLTNLETARDSLRSATAIGAGCPPGQEGKGTPVF